MYPKWEHFRKKSEKLSFQMESALEWQQLSKNFINYLRRIDYPQRFSPDVERQGQSFWPVKWLGCQMIKVSQPKTMEY